MQSCGPDCCLEELGEVVQNLVRTLQIFERGKLTSHGFTMSQCYTLFNLQHKPLTMNQISEKMNLDTSTMTRIVSTLERDGYVIRERWEEDRRVIMARLTSKGRDVVLQLDQEVRQFYGHIIEAIPAGQVENVLNSVNLLLKAFEKVRPFCC